MFYVKYMYTYLFENHVIEIIIHVHIFNSNVKYTYTVYKLYYLHRKTTRI